MDKVFTAIKNKWTTIAAVLVGAGAVGNVMMNGIPTDATGWVTFAVSIATSLGLFAAKDSTTGSKPS